MIKCIYILLFIFSSLAFLSPDHYFPWATYEGERFIFYASSLFGAVFLYNHKKNIKIDILHVFLLLLLLSSLFSYPYYTFKQYFYIFNLYLINLIIFSIIVKNEIYKNIKIIDFVCSILFFIGIVSAVFSIYQWLGLFKNSSWLSTSSQIRPFANLAQPNHLATALLLSLGACLYLINKYQIIAIIFFIPLLVFSMVLTQSRTVWLALICIFFMILIKWKSINQKVKYIIFLLIPMYMIFGYFLSQNNAVNIADRAASGFSRLLMWEDFFKVIPYLKFWGVGWKNIEYYQFLYGDKSPEYLMSYHNILFDLIVLFGFLGLIFFAYIFLKLLVVFKKIDNTSDFLIFTMLFVIINHSLLEYPLFYNYFLAIFLIFLFYLLIKYNPDKNILFINRNVFSIFVVFSIILTFFYTQYFEKNRSYYRSVFLGKCVNDFEKNMFFDEFNNLSLINCEKNILPENLSKFEAGLLHRPAPSNILKLVYVYHQLGEYHKRDILLNRYNVKYFPKYTLDEVLENKFFDR